MMEKVLAIIMLVVFFGGLYLIAEAIRPTEEELRKAK